MGTVKYWLLAVLCICTAFSMAGLTGAAYGEEASFAPAPISNVMQLSPVNDNRLWVAEGDAAAPEVGADAALHKGVAAEETTAEEPSKPLSITVKADWVSRYMFRGIDMLDDHGAYQPSVDIGLDCGLHFNVWSSFASSDRDGYEQLEDLDEVDYTIYYGKECLDGAITAEVGGVYYDIIGWEDNSYDYWEGYGKFTLSQLPLAPHAYFYYAYPEVSSAGCEGWSTCLGGSHSCELGAFPCFGSTDPMSLTFTGDVWYNGGSMYDINTGWACAVFGSALTVPLAHNLTFTPGVYYQVSMEDTVNEENEFWTQLSLAYTW